MTSTDNPTRELDAFGLAAEFPAPHRDQWVRQAAGALVRNLAPDDDPELVIGRLRSTTYDGIVIEPLYTGPLQAGSGDIGSHDGFPGSSPFVRGRTAVAGRTDGWDVRQLVDPTDPAATAVIELERGASSVWLDLRDLPVIDVDSLDQALSGVLLDLAPVSLEAGDRWPAAAEALIALWDRRGIRGEAASGSFGADPFGAYVTAGGTDDIADQVDTLTALAERIADSHRSVRVVTIDATRFHDAGASDGQELGFGLATAVATLRAFEAAGLDLTRSFAQIELRFAATADQFATIAKFRAARRLWARIAEASGIPDAAGSTTVHAVTSRAMMSRYDPWVNLLRATTACFAAGVGGADAITVLPYDIESDPNGSDLGRRIARNTQSILAKEANIARVIDPSGGSWYVEQLTEQLAEVAWARFQDVERSGGLIAAVDSGLIAEQIDAAWSARRRNLVTRRDPLTGVSEFPNVIEPVPPVVGLETRPVTTAEAASSRPNALVRRRYAEPFETLRARVDRFTTSSGNRPAVFLATIGAPAVHTARATFAKNLFEVAGFATVAGPSSSDPDEIATQFAASGAVVACICSSDPVYAEAAVAVATSLQAAGPTVLYLAGRPRDLVDELQAAGVDGFVVAGADVEQTLSELLDRLDVP